MMQRTEDALIDSISSLLQARQQMLDRHHTIPPHLEERLDYAIIALGYGFVPACNHGITYRDVSMALKRATKRIEQTFSPGLPQYRDAARTIVDAIKRHACAITLLGELHDL